MTPPPKDVTALLRALQDLRIGFEIVTERVAKATQLNPRDLSVLDVLNAHGPATPTAIADKTGITPTTLAAILTRLERDGRVSRYRNPQDARSSLLAITDDTVRELTELYADLNNHLIRAGATLTASERATITGFMQDLVTMVHRTPTPGHSPG